MLVSGGNSGGAASGGIHMHHELLAAALKGINVGTWRFDVDRDRVDWDEVTGSLLGMTAVEGLAFSEIPIHPEDVPIITGSLALRRSLQH